MSDNCELHNVRNLSLFMSLRILNGDDVSAIILHQFKFRLQLQRTTITVDPLCQLV